MAAIRYIVTDVDASVAFYVDVLGFELVERWGRRSPWSGTGRQVLVDDPSGNPIELFEPSDE